MALNPYAYRRAYSNDVFFGAESSQVNYHNALAGRPPRRTTYVHNPHLGNPMPFGDHARQLRAQVVPMGWNRELQYRMDLYKLYNPEEAWGPDGYGQTPLPDPTGMARPPVFYDQPSGMHDPPFEDRHVKYCIG